MKNTNLRGAVVLAMSATLLACTDMQDDLAIEDEAVATLDDDEPTLMPLMVQLYQDVNYRGDVRRAYKSEPMLGHGQGCTPGLWFGDVVSSVMVHRGPDYGVWRAKHGGKEPYVYLHQDNLYRGRRLALTIGGYPDLRDLDFENVASSMSIEPEALPPADLREPTEDAWWPVSPFSVILEAHTEPYSLRCSNPNYKMTIVGIVEDIGRDYGAAFNDKISSIDIVRGSNYDPYKIFTLYDDPGYSSYRHQFLHGYANLEDLRDRGRDNKISSVTIQH